MKLNKNFIKRLKQRDKKAFEWLFNTYSEILKGISLRYTKNPEVADDLVQETFITIYDKIEQYQGRGSFEGWMKRIIINLSLQYLRTSRKDLTEVAENNHFTEDAGEFAYEKEINFDNVKSVVLNTEFSSEEIFKLVEELPDGFRTVFSLYVIDGYKHKEIAEMLGISESTSKTQLLRARQHLQKKLYKLAVEKQKKIINENYQKLLNKNK